jgi:hypothetical protein
MANPGDFHDFCVRCGKLVHYEDMHCLGDSWYCSECHKEITGKLNDTRKVLWVSEDDGYCD